MRLQLALVLARMLPLAATPARAQDAAAANPPSSDPNVYVVSYIDAAATAKGQVATLLQAIGAKQAARSRASCASKCRSAYRRRTIS